MHKETSAAAEPGATSAVIGTEALAAETTEAEEPQAEESKVEESRPATTLPAPAPFRTSMEDQASLRMKENADAANQGVSTPLSPGTGSPKSRMSWLKTKFSRRQSRGQKGGAEEKEVANEEKGFVGGAALTGASANDSTGSLGASSRDAVALAGKAKEPEPIPVPAAESTTPAAEKFPEAETSATIDPSHDLAEPAILPSTIEPEPEPLPLTDEHERIGRPAHREEELSPVSPIEGTGSDMQPETRPAGHDEEEFQEARDNFNEDLAPPPTFPAEKRGSPAREARFTEVMD